MKPIARVAPLMLVSLMLSLHIADLRAGQLLNVVIVGSDFYCLFDPSCTVSKTETKTFFNLEGVVGDAVLHTWTFAASAGSAAEGAYGYEYQLEFVDAHEVEGPNCIESFRVRLGAPLATLDYNGDGVAGEPVYMFFGGDHKFVNSAERDGPFVTFFFRPFPLCPNPFGDKSVRFGVLAGGPPKSVPGDVESFKGVIQVGTLGPNLSGKVSFQLSLLYDTIATLPPGGFIAPSLHAGEGHRQAMLNRVNAALAHTEDGRNLPAIQLLHQLLLLTDGDADDWVQDDPQTRLNEQANLAGILRELIESLRDPDLAGGVS